MRRSGWRLETGLTYFTDFLADGSTELLVTNQSETKVILRSGAKIAGVTIEGLPVTEILHGYHRAQVDSDGRLTFAAEFLKVGAVNPLDPNNIISCLVIDIPI